MGSTSHAAFCFFCLFVCLFALANRLLLNVFGPFVYVGVQFCQIFPILFPFVFVHDDVYIMSIKEKYKLKQG